MIFTAFLTEIHQHNKNIKYLIEIKGKDKGNISKGETVRDEFRSKIIVKRILTLSLI